METLDEEREAIERNRRPLVAAREGPNRPDAETHCPLGSHTCQTRTDSLELIEPGMRTLGSRSSKMRRRVESGCREKQGPSDQSFVQQLQGGRRVIGDR